MKRENSRFTREELNKVIENWESVAQFNIGTCELKKTAIDLRGIGSQIINSENIDHIGYFLYRIEIKIPHQGKNIEIVTGESKTPKFEVNIGNSDYSFSICAEDYFEKFFKLFGTKELQVGDFEFDKKYLLETNDKSRLKDFLDQKTIDWLKSVSLCYFDFNSPKAKEKLAIYFTINEFDEKEIRRNIEMFKYCIDRLNTQGNKI